MHINKGLLISEISVNNFLAPGCENISNRSGNNGDEGIMGNVHVFMPFSLSIIPTLFDEQLTAGWPFFKNWCFELISSAVIKIEQIYVLILEILFDSAC